MGVALGLHGPFSKQEEAVLSRPSVGSKEHHLCWGWGELEQWRQREKAWLVGVQGVIPTPRKAVKPCREHSGLHSGTDEHGPLYLVEWQRGDIL